jgi:hypothetical protein
MADWLRLLFVTEDDPLYVIRLFHDRPALENALPHVALLESRVRMSLMSRPEGLPLRPAVPLNLSS